MKTVLLSASPEWKGGYWRIHFLGKYLKEMGFDVELMCGNSTPSAVAKTKFNDGMKVTLMPTAERKISKWIISQPYIVTASVIKSITKKSDVFHYFSCINPISLGATILHKGMKTVRIKNSKIVMDWEDWWWGNNDGVMKDYNVFFRKTSKIMEEMGPKLADEVTVVSECLKNRAKSIGINNVSEVPNGSNVDQIKIFDKKESRKKLGIPLDKKVICHIGFTNMVDAFLEVKKEFPDTILYIIGHKPSYAHIRIKSMKEHKDIIYTGRVNLETVNKYLAASDVACINMDNELAEEARWPIRLGDYMAAGSSIVAGNIGEVGKIINRENIGFTYKPGDMKDFGRQITKALKKKFSQNKIRKIAEKKYSWQQVAKKLAKVYEK